MERFLFKKVELWVVGLLVVLAVVGMIAFSAIALDEERGVADLGQDHFGALGDIALTAASFPETARQALKTVGTGNKTMMTFLDPPEDFPGGWIWHVDPAHAGLDGFLLISRYDGDARRHRMELMDLSSGEIRKSWQPDPLELIEGFDIRDVDEEVASFDINHPEYFRYIHPLLTRDGHLLLKDHQAPLVYLSACGQIDWQVDNQLFHHSTNVDSEGNFWVGGYDNPAGTERVRSDFSDDAIVRLDRNGRVTFKRSMSALLTKAGLTHIVFPGAHYYKDPMHLNDIEPVLQDGPYWKKGDLFLSFRTPSLVVLYRPSTDAVLWYQAGPWLSQHDVDIVDDHRIAVFSNNTYDRGKGARVLDVSETLIYDFHTKKTDSPWHATLEELKTQSVSEGLQEILPTGHLILEEENKGRIFILAPDGTVIASFLNRAQNGRPYRLGWSRYMPRAKAEAALAAQDRAVCHG
ncbi:MAG: arylsulfotransferase family protein [Marinibacterium sp.]